ncbi:Mis12 domain protein [Paecilomyces variotii No. 5]|uniref:Mis12 domain protein n=1 Tax=Byssochlamys spectabilis (strain No. 5 / NBRC 109023) TaxID=1356009 RepID=V5FPX5_BYSSN|nr:Mis12 domain protein [Paecilomyces variotii No. 5]
MNDTTTALLTEHFSYTPLSLIDDIINSINNLIYQAISSLESGLLSTPPERLGFSHANNGSTIPDTDADGNVEYPEARLEIENGLHQLETLLEATVDKAFDKFEIYVLRNILTVPEDLAGWIRLGHYESLSLNTLSSPNAPTPESINAQRKKLHETRKLQRALKQESARNEAIIAQLRSIISNAETTTTKQSESSGESQDLRTSRDPRLPDLSFLTSDPAAVQLRVGSGAESGTSNHLTTHATFILSQLPALRDMLNRLRPRLATLPKSTDEMELDSRKAERRAYIESRIRLHLERTGELAIDEGNIVLAGRKIRTNEAQAVENVMGMLADDEKRSSS